MLRNKRGEGYIQVSVLIIVICMLLSVFIVFISSVNTVRIVKMNSETVLESYITKNSIEIYNSIKLGTNDTDTLDASMYIDDLTKFCTLVRSGGFLYHRSADGVTDYYITIPTVGFTAKGKLKLYVNYTLYVPIYFNSARVTTAVIPVTVRLDLENKF